MPLSGFIDILEKFVPGEILTLFDDACQSAVGHVHAMPDPAFSSELESHRRTAHPYMPIPQGRQSERFVGPRILFVADAYQGGFEQTHYRG
jgi:hypothetical protein